MIEIHINKDVGSYEAKFIGPFTMRQTFCVCVAAPICWFIYKHVSPIVTADVAGFLMLIPAVIAWVIGWTKPYGMRPEKFLQSVFINMVLAPANRKYKTSEGTQDVAFSTDSPDQEADSVETNQKKSDMKQKKPRYKVSSYAVK